MGKEQMKKKGNRFFNSNFTLFLLGRTVSDMGIGIQMMIMPLYIIDVGGSAATIGLFSFLSLAPALMVYPFAGVLGDRLNRKTIMVTTDFISAGVILGLAFISYYHQMSLILLLLVQVMISLLNGLFDPATRGMLPQLVEKDKLTRANSTVASLKTLSLMLGPVIGAVLYANFGITMVFFVNGISFLLSGMSEIMINYIHVNREKALGMSGIFGDLSEGIKFIVADKIISKSCWFFLATYLFVQPIFQVVLPLFFKARLAYSDTRYGFLQSILVFGMLLGSFGVNSFFGKEKDMLKPLTFGSGLLLVSMLIFSILLFPYSLFILGEASILYFAIISIILCLFGASILFIHIPVQTFIQKRTPDEYMSRVFSLVNMISRGGTPIGALLYGIILEVVEVHWTIMSATLILVVITIILLTSLRKTIKRGAAKVS